MKKTIFLIVLITIFSCKNKSNKVHDLGVVNFEVSGKEKAVSAFEKGLLLLHSFEYTDARESFIEAQNLDSNMAMAYWGEAMTYNHSLWREQDFEDGLSVIKKIKSLDKSQLTPVEKDMILAVERLYKPKTAKKNRDKEYMEFMRQLYEKYPNNNEIAAFYALSLLGSVSEGRNDSIYGKGALVADKILKTNAEHPGALHYLIHSYDDPNHAHLALEAADAYAKVAPDASHALHMPSHIYVALGMWERVIASNIDSYQASVTRMKEKGLDNNARGYHAFHWLEYGYLQKGESKKAEDMVWEMQEFCKNKPSKRARVHLVFLKGTFLAETNLWKHPIADIELDVSGTNISIKGQNYFIEGMKAFTNKDKNKLDLIIEDFNSELKKESLLVDNVSSGFSVCASSDRSMPTRRDIKRAEVMKMQLLALNSWLANDLQQAESLLKTSVELENNLVYSYGPPSILIPSKELYGSFLNQQNRPQEAIILFEDALKKGVNRLTPLKGIEKSVELIGDQEQIEVIKKRIDII